MQIITTHLNADFDGLASMVAARKLYPEALLAFSGGAEETVRNFLALHDLGLVRAKDLDVDQITDLIVVDTQEPERLGLFGTLFEKPMVFLHIFDHHPDGEGVAPLLQSRVATLCVESVGATTTLMIEELQRRQLPISPFEATILAIGLYEETGSLAFVSTTPRDLDAAAVVLRAGADLTVVTDTLQHPLDPDQIALLNDLVQQGETLYLQGRKVLLASSVYDRYHGDLAEVVHRLAEMKGYDAVLAVMALEDRVEIIGRSRRPELDVAQVASEFGGGGHWVAAAASVKGSTVHEVRARVEALLHERWGQRLLAQDVMTQPVKSLDWTATIAEAETRLTKDGVNVLPVLGAGGEFQGLLMREIVQKALFHGLGETVASQFLQRDPYIALPTTPFSDVQQQMVERNQRCVPVLSNASPSGRVVGVITRTDLVRAMHEDLLAAGRVPSKTIPSAEEAPRVGRNVRNLIRQSVTVHRYDLLVRIGQLAERLEISGYIVGGFVRDLLLGLKPLDFDIVVEGDGLEFARRLAKQEQAQVKTHARFGTAQITFTDGLTLDVATARNEYYEYPTALPTVERSSIKKDLYRRDFTINTLAVCLNGSRFGEVLDFFGGQRDLKDKRLRVLHSLSFVEDPTRVFRAVRFEQRFGFQLSKDTLRLLQGAVQMELFHRLSGPRLLNELVLLLSEDSPSNGLARLRDLDLLRCIHPDLAAAPRTKGLINAVERTLHWASMALAGEDKDAQATPPSEPAAAYHPWIVVFLALCDPLSPAAWDEMVTRLHCAKQDVVIMTAARTGWNTVGPALMRRGAMPPSAIYRLLHPYALEAILFFMAKVTAPMVNKRLADYVTVSRSVHPVLSGKDLVALGLTTGPQFRAILDRLLDARLDGEVHTRADEVTLAQAFAAGVR
jgi:tRNA nucleotidyltransferase (CCA-adding enzyme)